MAALRVQAWLKAGSLELAQRWAQDSKLGADDALSSGRLGRLADIRGLIRHAKSSGTVHLSEREREILRLIAEGRSNQEIARLLVVAVGTVKIHVHNLFQKLEARSRTQAVARARKLDLLP